MTNIDIQKTHYSVYPILRIVTIFMTKIDFAKPSACLYKQQIISPILNLNMILMSVFHFLMAV